MTNPSHRKVLWPLGLTVEPVVDGSVGHAIDTARFLGDTLTDLINVEARLVNQAA